MCSGERLMGAAKGKQSDTVALCPPPPRSRNPRHRSLRRDHRTPAPPSDPLPRRPPRAQDTYGPATNIVMKLMAIVSVVFAPVVADPRFGGLIFDRLLWPWAAKDA